ncbi:hypothetical protein [Alkalicoccus chagannorensis]|uniref:hypothetical protein n=1 Tax=Alkalicoccus chagannorensis TaxID=427072 RepID=UPI00040CD672|nr:hypothetical protein [Alkalicoccus chagannorensis]
MKRKNNTYETKDQALQKKAAFQQREQDLKQKRGARNYPRLNREAAESIGLL